MPLNDLRYAFRLMRRSPAFTAAAVLSLALGIGGNTALFSLFYTIMLRPLSVEKPHELVELVRNTPTETHWDGYWGGDRYEYFRDHNHVFSGLTGMSFDNLAPVRAPGSETETVVLEATPANYFRVLGLHPALGRFFGPGEAPAAGEGDVAVVSWAYWNRHFHRDPAILGRRIFYKDSRKTIIGVAPRGYVGPRVGNRTDVWIPVGRDFGFVMLGRLNRGVSLRQAEAEMDVLYRSLPRAQGSSRPAQAKVELLPAGAGLARVQDRFGRPLVLLLAVNGLLLLLACINMASMLLARSAARERELAVRVGLGAGRGHLLRQMLTESLLLSAAGMLAGVLVAYFGTQAMVRILASSRAFERVEIEVHPDLPVLLFAAAAALLTGLLFGIAPAWYAARSAPASVLCRTGRGAAPAWRWFSKGLVTAQVALSLLLVSAAAVFLNHLARLRDFDLGFRSDHVLLVTVDTAPSGYRSEQLAAPYRALLARFETIPGVRSASVSGCTPLEGCGSGARFLSVEGHMEPPEHRLRTALAYVAPRYFETLGIPLVAGRSFSFRDAGMPHAAIVNEAMARHYFPGLNPIGRRVTVERDPSSGDQPGPGDPYEIIGVAGDAKIFELRDAPYPAIYFNMFQEGRFLNRFELRTAVEPESVAGTVRQIVREALNAAPVTRLATLDDQVDSNLVSERLIATLSEFFGCVAAVLAGIGLYGLLAYTVARRTHEIGIRMALGATAESVRRLVLREALGMTSAGLAAGTCLVLWARPLATSVLHDLRWEPAAPLAIGGAISLAAALFAAYVPVRRAVRVDPMAALRHE